MANSDVSRHAAWKKYRKQVKHPVLGNKAADLERARQNLEHHGWAQDVLKGMRGEVAHTLAQGKEHVVRMISETTPGGVGFTNCPGCEGNTIHGAYDWNPEDPEHLVCTTCKLVYPNEKYPEDMVFCAKKHGNGQEISYHGGYSLDVHGFHLFSSWTAQIRARKVFYMASQAQTLATVYALTGERSYGEKACEILLRFAQVYPGYLVHSSYGEWIDLPPHQVAACINELPEDEWTLAPNKPDRKLHSGYWNSGRATGLGMEGTFVRQVAAAYDLVYGLLKDDEQIQIEKDLLLESTVWMLADPALNNKSVCNLSAAGLVGMVVGDPGLVRAGATGFWHFAKEWFLFDGTTSESPAYGLMTLNGMWAFGEALHGYTDPEGYDAPDRMETFDLYADGNYRAVFRAFYDTMFPNLGYPASADSYVSTSLGAHYAELMVARFDLPEYRALLAEVLGGPVAETGGEYALFHREAAFSVQPGERVVLEDVFLPALRMGYFRQGTDGRKGTVILDASHWGGHHHRDSLNLTLFQEGHEVLTDLGYLWDRPDKQMTVRTPAHNLVVVDEAEQETQGRKGSLHLFDATDRVKVMACSSEAYPQTSLYRRTCIQVDHGKDGCYFVDLFEVSGGEKHDYLFHGPIPDFQEEGISLEPAEKEGSYGIRNVRGGTEERSWRLSWQMDPAVSFSAWALPDEGEQVLIGEGWGERGWGHFNAEDKKADIPYVIRRREGTDLSSIFVSVFEVHRGEGLVTGMKRLSVEGEGVALEVETRFGKDVLLASLLSGSGKSVRASGGMLEMDGFLAVASEDFLYATGGAYARSGNMEVNPVPNVQGTVRSYENGNEDSFFVVGKISDAQVLVGQMVLVDDGESTTGYRVQDVEVLSSDTRIYTKKDGIGYDLGGGATWSVVGSDLTV